MMSTLEAAKPSPSHLLAQLLRAEMSRERRAAAGLPPIAPAQGLVAPPPVTVDELIRALGQ
jgi:hypothetical protein